MLTLNGRPEEAVPLLKRALDNARSGHSDLYAEAEYLAHLGEAYLAAGDLIAARTAAEEGVTIGRARGTMLLEARSHLAFARILLRQEGDRASEDIRKALDQAEDLHTKTGARNLHALVHLERAELARLEGDAGARRRELEAALRLFREMKAPIRVGEVERLLADAE
jgi:tetratricopeptide (TPR) repeat protein